jgi:acyl-CoA thioester hydrolase
LAEKNNSTDFSGETPFRWPIRVYYEDTDAGGVVYHANYLRFLERARTERLRALGFELDELREREDILFVVRSMELDFLKPARFNEALWVTAEMEQIRSASIFFRQAIFRGESELLCEARVRVVCLSAAAFRPKPVPDFMVRCLRG